MQDYVSLVQQSILSVLTQHASFFEAAGLNLFRSFAIILLVLFGSQAVLSGAEGSGGFPWARFIALVQELVVVYVMLAFYSIPIPGLGISFTHLVLDQATAMVGQLNEARTQEILETLNTVESNLPYPSPIEILAILRFFVVLACVLAAEAVTLYVVLFGYVATGVLVLLGPVFIPFKVFPQMDWLFWGWLRAFIQYAFYQVVASAYVFVFGDFLLQILGGRSSPLSTGDLAVTFVPLVLTLVTFTLGTIKVPELTFSLFSGRAGGYVLLWRK